MTAAPEAPRGAVWRAAGVFAAAAVAATWPLAPRLATHLPAGANDLFQNVWNLWWWKKALLDLGATPFWTPYLYAPEGLDLTFHTHSPLTMLMTLPVNALLGPVAAYNAAVLLAVALCGLGAYLLARELVRDEAAAVAAGLVFALFPQHQEQLLEHLNLLSCQWMPFALLFLVRSLRYGRRADGVLAGVFYALNALACYHLGLLLTLVGIPIAAWYLRESPCRRRALAGLGAGAAAGAAMLLPFVWPMAKAMLGGEAFFVKPLEYRPVDPAFFAIPPPASTLLGGVFEDIYRAHRGSEFQYAGFVCFMGWIPLLAVARVAAGLGKRAGRGEKLLWLGVFLGFSLFACGKCLTFLGTTYEGVSLPQGWTQEFGPFRVLRIANRYLIPASLALAVLTAQGLVRLPLRAPGAWALAALVALEFLWVPFPTAALVPHPYMRELARDPRAGVVLELPPCLDASRVDHMLDQMVHGKPIAGGYSACTPPALRETVRELLRGLGVEPEDLRIPPPIDRALLDALRRRGVGTIILRPGETREAFRAAREEALARGELPFFLRLLRPARALPERRLEVIAAQLTRLLGPPIYEDGELAVWRL